MAKPLLGTLLLNEPLANYTSWRVGGPADRLYLPKDKADLQNFIAQLSAQEPLTYLGLGSNVLIRDGGVRGTVVNTRGKLKQMYWLDASTLYVECGVPCAHVAKFCAQQGQQGAAFLAGIPGTMGGALKMNAGAFGYETWDLVQSVDMLSVMDGLVSHKADEFEVGYRSVSVLENNFFVSARLCFSGHSSTEGETIKTLLAKRNASQPTNVPTCGSVFKNPANDYAARLIEVSDLKGYRLGGAEVSSKHANFIINTGKATALEIEQLIAYVQAQVYQQQGIKLTTEVCIMGQKNA